jgi:pilus assembly protein Flp/PilA
MFSQLHESALKLYVKAETLISDERGQDLIEYALLAGLIAVVCVAGMQGVASAIKNVFSAISTELGTA